MTVRPTQIPGIAKVPANIDPATRQVLESIIEAVEIRLGRKGDPIDRAITLRELIDGGLALRLKATPFDPNRGGSSNLGFQPPVRAKHPTKLTSFVASAAYSQVNLFWDAAYYEGHNQTEIWSHTSDILGDATLAGVSTGISMIDPVGSGVSRYYWARHVNLNGVYGDWNNAAGTLATTATDVAHQLAVLGGAITASELAQSLATPIGSISGINGSISTINGQISTLNQTVAALNNTSAWASGQSYSTNDQVTYSGNLFSAKSDHTSTSGTAPPTSTTSNTTWLFVGAYTSLSSVVGANTGSIAQLNTVSASSTSAAAQAIHALNSTVNNGTSGVVATADALDVIETAVNHTDTGVVASSQKIIALENTVNDSSTGVAATASAFDVVRTTVNHGTDGVVASSQKITALENTVNDSSTGVVATAAAFDVVRTTVNHGTDGVAASAQKIGTLNNAVFDSSGAMQLVSSATLTNDYQTKAAADAAYASSTNLLSAQVANPDGSANTVALSQAMTVQAATNGALKGQYSVKIDSQGHITGFGLSSTNTTAGPTSAFIVNADKFAVIDPASSDDGLGTTSPTAANIPFFIDGGVTYIKAAAIKDATITAAKIGSVDADTISAGTLSANFISGGTIDASTINIVGTGGTFNIKSSSSGARMEMTGSTIRIFDGNNVNRVKLGAL